MAFFVVQRDADSGLSIPLPDSYPTREAAIAALSSATASGSLALTGEVFIADLGTAVPVLLMAVPSGPAAEVAPEPAEEPVVEAVDAEPVVEEVAPEPEAAEEVETEPEVAESLDEQAADEVYSGSSFLGDEQSLAAALKRAASSLEDEGIVAPASIESAPAEDQAEAESEAAEWPWANVEAYTAEAEPEPEQEPEPEPEAEPEQEPEPVEEEVAPADAPAIIEYAEAPQEPADPTEDAAELPGAEATAEGEDEAQLLGEIVALGETASEPAAEQPEDVAAAEIEDAADDSPYLEAPAVEVLEPLSIAGITDTDPVIVDTPVEEAVMLPEDQPIITSAPAAGEEAYVPRPVILGDYADVVTPGGDVEFQPLAETSNVPETDLVITSPEPLTGYEAQGDPGFEEYTCQDCVYANTCPKVGEATPADCGSFQWRAE